MPLTTYFAKLKYPPTEPSTTQPGKLPPQHSTVLIFDNGEEERIYFDPGPLSHLEAGDIVVAEYSRGKWRVYERSQPPELLETLRRRTQTGTTAIVQQHNGIARAAAPTQAEVQRAWSQQVMGKTGEDYLDIAEMAIIFKGLRMQLPGVGDEVIASLAQSVFKYRRDSR